MSTGPEETWVDAGGLTSCAIVEGRIYAVLFWQEGWRLRFTDDPGKRIALAPDPAKRRAIHAPRYDTPDDTANAKEFAWQIVRMHLGLPSMPNE